MSKDPHGSRFTFHVSRFTFHAPTSPNSKFKVQSSKFTLAAHTFIILAVALSIRLAYWVDAGGYSLAADEPDYVIPAQTLVRDGRYVDTFVSHERLWTRVPLNALFFAASFLPVDDAEAQGALGDDAALMEKRYAALNLAQIGLSLVTVALIMLLAARAFPGRARRAALIAGWIAALYPPLASSPAQRALSEPLAVVMICLAFVVLSFWSPHLPARRSLFIAGAAGALLGLTALARSVGLAFLPVAILWMFVTHRYAMRAAALPHHGGTEGTEVKEGERVKGSSMTRPRFARRPIAAALVATVACFLVIAPWTYYNYTQYRTFLLLETANATAFWHYHNFRGEDYEKRLHELPNPADRLALIVKEGTANIVEYPEKAVRAAIFAFGYFWHLESNSAVLLHPWDMTQRDPDVPDLLHSDAFFLLVGLVGMAGLAGVALRRPVGLGGRTLLLINLWFLSTALLGIIVPYDGRYRLPAAPPIIIYAAGLLALTDWRVLLSPGRAWAALRARPWVAALTGVLLAWVLVGAYTPNIPPLLRSLYHAWWGDIALQSGDIETAWGRYELSQQVFPNFYWPYRHHADMAASMGRDDEARALYAAGRELNSEDQYGMLGLSQLIHRQSWTPTPEESRWLQSDEADWRGNPWNSFRPSPTESIDVGGGGDIPFIRGFHRPDRTPERSYRWSRGRASIRLPVAGVVPRKLTLRMSAPALGASEPMPVTVSIEGGPPVRLDVPVGWADYALDVPNGGSIFKEPGTLWVHISSPTLTPALSEPGSNDERGLGVGLDSVTLGSEP